MEVLLAVGHLPENEIEVTLEKVYVAAEKNRLALVGLPLIFQIVEAKLAQIASDEVLPLDKIVFCQILEGERIARIRLESTLK